MGTTYNAIFRNGKKIADATGEEVNALKNSKATTGAYGLGKITQATSVTDPNSGLLLGAVEKNASVSGSLKSDIVNLQNEINSIKEYTNGITGDGTYITNFVANLYKYHKIALFSFSALVIKKINVDSPILFTLPSECRPIVNSNIFVLTQYAYPNSTSGTSRIFDLSVDGSVHNANISDAIQPDMWIRGAAQYVTV